MGNFFEKLVYGSYENDYDYDYGYGYGPRRYGYLLDQLIFKTKAKMDISMSAVKLVGSGSTNVKALLDETLLDDLQAVNIDLVAKIDKLSIKVSNKRFSNHELNLG